MPDTLTQTNEYPILFKPDMVNAILQGRKTQTRRVLKTKCDMYDAPRKIQCGDMSSYQDCEEGDYGFFSHDAVYKSPYGQPGDILWVRENFRLPQKCDDVSPKEYVEATDEDHWAVWTEADGYINGASAGGGAMDDGSGGWDAKDHFGRLRRSIHMPRELCRLRLRVEDVHVERVREITEEGAKAEGCTEPCGLGTPRNVFAMLWNRINADRGFPWKDNPFVWVIRFSPITDH